MNEQEERKQKEYNDRTKGAVFFARYRASKLMQEHDLSVDLAVALAEDFAKLHTQGKEQGTWSALYERLASFPWGILVHVHKVREYRVVEFRDNVDGHIWYCAQKNDSNWGRRWTTFEGALIDAIASTQEGWESGAGFYAARVAGFEDREEGQVDV